MVLASTTTLPTTTTSPSKQSCGKKTSRKGSYGQSTKPIFANEVGDFQGGYFVMPTTSPTSSPSKSSNKSNYPSSYDKKNKRYETPQRDVGPSPPKNTYNDNNVANKLETTPIKKIPSRKSFSSPKTTVSPSTSPSSTTIHTVPISSTNKGNEVATRWAGPAFSNAPPPSSLPLPSFPPVSPSPPPPSSSQSSNPSVTQYPQHPVQSIPAQHVSYSHPHPPHHPHNGLASYPFVQTNDMIPPVVSSLPPPHHHHPSYVHYPDPEASWLSSLTMPHHSTFHHHPSSHPVVVSANSHHHHHDTVTSSSYPPYAPLPMPPPVSLADLSTDLRRMLNISSSPSTMTPPMMTDHRLESRLIPVHSS